MSYEPTKWQTGDIITLNKLNKLEQGVAAMIEEYEPTVWQIGDTVTSIKLNKLEQAVATLSENSGGGTELGELQAMSMITNSQPRVGQDLDSPSPLEVVKMSIGEQFVFSNSSDNYVFMNTVAAGTTVIAHVDRASEIKDISMYLVTVTQASTSFTIETLEDFDLDVSVDQDHGTISFVMPEWNAKEGQFPIMYINRTPS